MKKIGTNTLQYECVQRILKWVFTNYTDVCVKTSSTSSSFFIFINIIDKMPNRLLKDLNVPKCWMGRARACVCVWVCSLSFTTLIALQFLISITWKVLSQSVSALANNKRRCIVQYLPFIHSHLLEMQRKKSEWKANFCDGDGKNHGIGLH